MISGRFVGSTTVEWNVAFLDEVTLHGARMLQSLEISLQGRKARSQQRSQMGFGMVTCKVLKIVSHPQICHHLPFLYFFMGWTIDISWVMAFLRPQ